MEWLGVEKLVGDKHAAGGEVRRGAEAESAKLSELRRDTGVMRLARLGADFDQGMRLQVANQGLRRPGDQLTEHRPEGRRGGEIGAGGLADAHALRGIITEPGSIERRRHQSGERDHAAAGLATKQGDDGVMSVRGLHRRSVMRSFPLRQTNRD